MIRLAVWWEIYCQSNVSNVWNSFTSVGSMLVGGLNDKIEAKINDFEVEERNQKKGK